MQDKTSSNKSAKSATVKPMKRSRGRPSLGDDARNAKVQIRVTEGEREEIDRAAGEAGVSDWGRDVLLEQARKKSVRKGPR